MDYEVIWKSLISDLTQRWEEFKSIRQYLHGHPEKTNAEYDTAKYVADILNKNGIPYKEHVGGQGIIALIEGKEEGPTIALRGDMDALEISETTGLPYASIHPNLMHACGHDFHMSAVLAVGILLNSHRETLHGRIKIIFQPAEENGPTGGAKPMIEDGVLQNPEVDAIFGAHVSPNIPLGKFLIVEGPASAAADNFIIKIKGKGGHAANPHLTIDPITIAAQIVLAFNSIISRNVPVGQCAVLSIGRIQGGIRRNVIPDIVELEGTARTLYQNTRELIKKRIYEISANICASFEAEAEIEWFKSYDATVNNPEMTKIVKNSLGRFLGRDAIVEESAPNMTSEDFGYFLQKVRGAFFWVGAEGDIPMNLHSGNLAIKDVVLMDLIKAFLGIVLGYFEYCEIEGR